MSSEIYDSSLQLPKNFLQSCRKMQLPEILLMCPPDSFDVVDVKNPHMQGNIGRVDRKKAHEQWEKLRQTFVGAGAKVRLIKAIDSCEDMVFCANQTFVGLDKEGQRVCVPSHMKYPSRQREVCAFREWFSDCGYAIKELPANTGFEGSGDAVWHPGRAIIWGGSGFRTQPESYEFISEIFGAPVIRLPLNSDRFYHLDTCFAAIDEKTVLVHAASLTQEGMTMIRSVFENVIECDDREAGEGMACNLTSIGGKHIVIQKGNSKTVTLLSSLGYAVHEVETGEFLKSGGSVFCMKMYVF